MMNINQQAEIEDLFRRINKTISKNSKVKVGDEDLNKVRAYVVQSQRPLQAVRLLQREREERETDEKFNSQKEQIISDAQKLEIEKNKFKEEQQKMINKVKKQISTITAQYNMKQAEEAKLENEHRIIKEKQSQIEDLKVKLQETKDNLRRKEEEKKQLEKFNTFLESIVQEKGGQGAQGGANAGGQGQGQGEREFADIEALQNRFKNLKTENDKLMKRKLQINQEMERARQNEAQKLGELQNTLYDQQRKMQSLQVELERIHEKNSALEQDFENEINRNNKNKKEIGQIINSINNIFLICRKQQVKRGKLKSTDDEQEVNEETKDLVTQLIKRLETSSEIIEDLKTVLDQVGIDYDRDKAYNEGIFNQAAAMGGTGQKQNLGNQSSLGVISGAGAGGQNQGGNGLSGGQTGKLGGTKTKKTQPSSTNVDGGASLLDAAKSSKSGAD